MIEAIIVTCRCGALAKNHPVKSCHYPKMAKIPDVIYMTRMQAERRLAMTDSIEEAFSKLHLNADAAAEPLARDFALAVLEDLGVPCNTSGCALVVHPICKEAKALSKRIQALGAKP